MDQPRRGSARNAHPVLRRVYGRLDRIRFAQLRYMRRMKRTSSDFKYLLAPDLVFQYNDMYHVLECLGENPPPISENCGDIECSEPLTLTASEATVSARSGGYIPSTDGNDDIASRVVGLQGQVVSGINRHDLSSSLREEFATQFHRLSSLLERQYQSFSARVDVLADELSNARLKMASDKTMTNGNTFRLSNLIARYKRQLTYVRAQVERLQVMEDRAVQQRGNEIERVKRLGDGAEMYEKIVYIVVNLIETVMKRVRLERERAWSVVQRVQLNAAPHLVDCISFPLFTSCDEERRKCLSELEHVKAELFKCVSRVESRISELNVIFDSDKSALLARLARCKDQLHIDNKDLERQIAKLVDERAQGQLDEYVNRQRLSITEYYKAQVKNEVDARIKSYEREQRQKMEDSLKKHQEKLTEEMTKRLDDYIKEQTRYDLVETEDPEQGVLRRYRDVLREIIGDTLTPREKKEKKSQFATALDMESRIANLSFGSNSGHSHDDDFTKRAYFIIQKHMASLLTVMNDVYEFTVSQANEISKQLQPVTEILRKEFLVCFSDYVELVCGCSLSKNYPLFKVFDHAFNKLLPIELEINEIFQIYFVTSPQTDNNESWVKDSITKRSNQSKDRFDSEDRHVHDDRPLSKREEADYNLLKDAIQRKDTVIRKIKRDITELQSCLPPSKLLPNADLFDRYDDISRYAAAHDAEVTIREKYNTVVNTVNWLAKEYKNQYNNVEHVNYSNPILENYDHEMEKLLEDANSKLALSLPHRSTLTPHTPLPAFLNSPSWTEDENHDNIMRAIVDIYHMTWDKSVLDTFKTLVGDDDVITLE